MKLPWRKKRVSRGQAMVEFALVLPLLALLLVMAIDFGRVFFGWVALQNVARVGANYAAQHPTADWGNAADPDRVAYELRMRQDAAAINCTLPGALPTPVFTDANANGITTDLNDYVTVDLDCDFTLLTPLAGNLLGQPLSIAANATFPIRSGIIAGAPVQTSVPTPSPTPTPPAGPTPTPTPTPAPGPVGCLVPQFIGDLHNDTALTNKWTGAGFKANKITIQGGSWATVGSQSQIPGSDLNCNSTQITVGP